MIDLLLAGAIAVKTALLLLVAALAAAALTKRSSALRHALWTGTLVLSLLMPVAVLTLPTLAVIPASWLSPEAAVATGAAEAAAPSLDLWTLASTLWLAGAILLLLRLFVAQLGLLRWQSRARLLHSCAWTGTLERLSSRLPIPRSLRVLESPAVANPCTWGFIRPVLLLPSSGDSWTEAERQLALLHELAHVRRHDWLTATLGRLACAMHWYNPLVWLAARESGRLQEQACDDFVLRSGALPSHYASFLRHAAANEQGGVPRLATAMGVVGRTQLRERVDSILDPERRRTPLSSARAFGLWFASICFALFLGAVAPQTPAGAAHPLALEETVADAVSVANADHLADKVATDESDRQPTQPIPPTPPVPPVPPVQPIPPVPPVPPELPSGEPAPNEASMARA